MSLISRDEIQYVIRLQMSIVVTPLNVKPHNCRRDQCAVYILYYKISTDPGLLKIRHSHRFFAVIIQFLISFMDIVQVLLFWLFMAESRSKISLSKKERNQYLAILTQKGWSIRDLLFDLRKKTNKQIRGTKRVVR